MAEDMTAVFLNADEFAEPAIYMKADGTIRTIMVSVARGDVRGREETARGVAQTMTVVAKNDATLGILATEIKPTDALFLPWEEGKTLDRTDLSQKHMLTSPIEQDPAALTLRFGPR